jgi:hypothetical protein
MLFLSYEEPRPKNVVSILQKCIVYMSENDILKHIVLYKLCILYEFTVKYPIYNKIKITICRF